MWCILHKTSPGWNFQVAKPQKRIQLFRERLSYTRGKAYATMSQVIMGNGGFLRLLE